MSETVTTDLSRISGLLVISSATAAALKERVDVRQLCSELGVQYAVKGSIQRDGQNVRINAQLVDCRSAVQIWSERFDGDSSDLFALQDRITGRIANSIGREIIVAAERDREMCNTDPNSSDLLMKGIVADNKPQCLESLQEQEHLFGQALHLDPKNSDALARLARAILLQSIQLHVPMQMKQEKLSQGADAAEKAVHANPNHARAHLAMGLLHMLRGEFALAVLANETAISLDRNLTQAHSNLGNSLVHLGRAREAIRPLEVAIRLDPSGPQVGAFQSAMGLAQLQLGHTQSAVEWFSRARASNPRLARAHAGLAMALAVDGDALGARVAVADLLRLAHDYRLSQTIDAPFPASPARYRQFYEEVLMPAAKKAGVPA